MRDCVTAPASPLVFFDSKTGILHYANIWLSGSSVVFIWRSKHTVRWQARQHCWGTSYGCNIDTRAGCSSRTPLYGVQEVGVRVLLFLRSG